MGHAPRGRMALNFEIGDMILQLFIEVKQYGSANDCDSDFKSVKCVVNLFHRTTLSEGTREGVPQGSSLGPLLF